MEALAVASSVIAVLQIASQLISMAKILKNTLDEMSYKRIKLCDLAQHIVQCLETLEKHIKDRQADINATELRKSLSSLFSDLEQALNRCRRLSRPRTILHRIATWKDQVNIFMEIGRIEKKINRCHQSFTMSSIARIELSTAEFVAISNQIRNELSDGFGRLEARLQRASEASALDGGRLRLVKADLTNESFPSIGEECPLSCLETQYLEHSVTALTSSLSQQSLDLTDEAFRPSSPSEEQSIQTFSTHIQPVGDPSHERQDAIMNTIRIIRLLRQQDLTVSLEDLVRDLERLSQALSDIGLYADACKVCKQVVKIYRICAYRNSDILVNLCWSLINLSAVLGTLGHDEDALEAVREAIGIGRRLPDNRVQISMALIDASVYLIHLGRYDEAMRATEEATEIRGSLAVERPDLYIFDLAVSLTAGSISLHLLGNCNAALPRAQRAVEILQGLYEQKPGQFGSMLAYSLNILSHLFAQFTHFEDALRTSRQSVEIFRRLAHNRPEVFNGGLAISLRALSVALSGLGMCHESLTAIQEALFIQQSAEMNLNQPKYVTADLALSLMRAASCLLDLGRPEQALEFSVESLRILRQFISRFPLVFDYNLAGCLRTFSKCLSGLGRHEAALEAALESVALCRDICKRQYPESYAPGFGYSLLIAASCYLKLGFLDEGIEMVKEAVDAYRIIAQEPDVAPLTAAYSLVSSPILKNATTNKSTIIDVEDAIKILSRLRSSQKGYIVSIWFAQTGEIFGNRTT